MTTILAIYGAVLSTLLAIPTFRNLLTQYFSPLRFICRSYTAHLVEQDKEPTIKYLFDITVINRTKERLNLSNCEIELRYTKDRITLTDSVLVNNKFNHQIEPGSSTQEFGMCWDNPKNLEETESVKFFNKHRFIYEKSNGKKIKSKWFSNEIYFNSKTAKWTRLDKTEFQKNLI